jgi:hypothetical protein
MRKNKNNYDKFLKSEKPLSNALIDDLLTTRVFQSPVEEDLSLEVEKLLENF